MKRPKKSVLLDVLHDAKRSARCICGNPKRAAEILCKRCEARLDRVAKSGVRSTIELNQAEGYFDAVTLLETQCVLREGATESTFGGGQ